MRLFFSALLSFGWPLVTVAQSWLPDGTLGGPIRTDQPAPMISASQTSGALRLATPGLAYDPVRVAGLQRSVVQYPLAPNLTMQALAGQRSWAFAGAPMVNETGLGLLFHQGRYSMGLSMLEQSAAPTARPQLLPGPVRAEALANLSQGRQIGAVGRLALDQHSGIDLGASVGRFDLLPGSVLPVSRVEQTSLSLGVDHGPVSGAVVGRMVELQDGTNPSIYGPDRSWSSIDVGVTVALPWKGEINVGARNLWSSGSSSATQSRLIHSDSDKSRTPYVQYRQDL